MPTITIKPSNKKDKKYDAFIYYNNAQKRPKVVSFGAKGYDDYVGTESSATTKQREAYLSRHDKEKDQSFDTPGALSYYLLWGKSRSIRENIKSFKKRYNLK